MMHFVLASLAKDKTAWIGSVSSFIAVVTTKIQDIQLPVTLEGWTAIALSLVTIFYILTKTVILIRSNRANKK